jgi:S1-C subfamily serine protease
VAGGAQNIGFAIPVREVEGAINSVKASGRIVRPYLGVHYLAVTKEMARLEDLKVTEGAYISGGDGSPGVIANSPAAKAGLREGDVITKINDQKIDSKNSLQSVIGRLKVGDKVSLTVQRGDSQLKLVATLEEAG